MMEVVEEQSKGRVARAREAFETSRTKTGNSRAEYMELLGHPSETAAACGRNADILVLARPRQEDEPMAANLAESCLFGPGRPILLVPPTVPPVSAKRWPSFGTAVAPRDGRSGTHSR